MSDDFSQMESHVESAVCGLRSVQGAGKYPKKVCSAAMYGANMLNAQKGAISNLRHDNDRMVEEIAELRSFVKKVSELDIETFHFETQGGDEDCFEYVCTDIVGDAVELLAKLNQEGEK